MVARPYAHIPGLLVDVNPGLEWMTPHDGRVRQYVLQNGTERPLRLSLTFVPESGALHIFVEAPRSARRTAKPAKRVRSRARK